MLVGVRLKRRTNRARVETTFLKITLFQTVEEFVRDSMDVITEADRLNVDGATGKLIICTPYHYDDPISKLCTALIKQTVDNELSIDVSIICSLTENVQSFCYSRDAIRVRPWRGIVSGA